MTRDTARRAVTNLSRRPGRFFRAFLAEDYDGIGQYISVTLSKGSTAAALKGRIASGDFGGRRAFPVGTPVSVLSYKGTLEVFLGNLPGACDLFNGATEQFQGGWNISRYGERIWLRDSELVELTPTVGPDYETWVEDGEALMRYPQGFFSENNPVMGLRFPDGLEYPMEVTFEYYITGSPFGNDYTNFNLYFGPYYFYDIDTWIVAYSQYDSGNVVYSANSSDNGGYTWPIDTAIELDVPQTVLEAQDPRWVKVRVDEDGMHIKTWRSDEDESDDFQLLAAWTGAPPPSNYYRYIYLEEQSLTLPNSLPQPIFHLKTFCLNENPH